MKKLLFPALFSLALYACSDHAATTPEATAGAPAATETPAAAPAEAAATSDDPGDYQRYAQYLWCRIDGQPYLAYYADGHTSNISNPLNMASRTDFATSADQVPLNGDTKISELHLILFNLAKKRAGEYHSTSEFNLDGHTSFAKKTGPGLDEIHFMVSEGQSLTVTSLKEGVAEGTFSLDVVDENDKSHVLKLTDGHFRLALDGGVKEISQKKDGDVDMDKLMKDMVK